MSKLTYGDLLVIRDQLRKDAKYLEQWKPDSQGGYDYKAKTLNRLLDIDHKLVDILNECPAVVNEIDLSDKPDNAKKKQKRKS